MASTQRSRRTRLFPRPTVRIPTISLDAAAQLARDEVESLRRWLASPAGKRTRELLAAGVVAASPVIMNHPALRASRIVRLFGIAGAGALLVKLAESIKDWEPSVVDVSPPGHIPPEEAPSR
jgi:hypothetical protein